MKVTSLNNILKLGAPLSANKLFKNQTYDLNVHKRGFLGIYDVNLSQIHSNDVAGFSNVNLGFIEGTDDLILTIGGVNIDLNLTADIKALGFIKGTI